MLLVVNKKKNLEVFLKFYFFVDLVPIVIELKWEHWCSDSLVFGVTRKLKNMTIFKTEGI